MVNVYKTKLDIKDVKPNFKPTIVQYDHVRLEIELFDDGKNYDYSLIDRVEFTHLRSDGLAIIQSGEIVTIGNKKFIRYEYLGSEMDLLGEVKISFALFDLDDKKVSSHAFTVVIVKDLRDSIFEPASPNYGLLQKILDDIKNLKEQGGVIGNDGRDGRDGRDGIDGYTPIKGIDYFDGIDGKDGKDGLDGKDGYTPIKGVDYHDGVDGKDFTFEDFTPEQLELLRGEKGDKGDAGEGANLSEHEQSVAPHQYGGKFEWRYNPNTNSLDLVVLD